jgi:ketopantoate reductase
MRREYDAVAEKGLRITSPDGEMYFEDPPIVRSMEEFAETRAAAAAAAAGGGEGDRPVDWVIIALKTTSFPAIPSLLSDRRVLGKETRVLALMNGYGLEKDLEAKAGVEGGRIFGGMAFVCANRGPVGSGEVAHLKYGKLVIGHQQVSQASVSSFLVLSCLSLFSFRSGPPFDLIALSSSLPPSILTGRPRRAFLRLPPLPGSQSRGTSSLPLLVPFFLSTALLPFGPPSA